MDPEVWHRITEIFDAALEQPSEERHAYVERACASEPALRSQVLYLLTEFDKAGTFLEESPARSSSTFSPNDVIAGRYRLEALIGRGGMGEVYRAHDQFVDEPIALKILRESLASDAAFLRGFRREVQLARKVTHVNVCRVFDLGIHSDRTSRPVHFLTMQLLDGETLAARIRRSGPLPIELALTLAGQMAEGLQAAHAAGIVHRDFKSANVMISNGVAVITDFGLARLTRAALSGDSIGTMTVNAQIAGTVAYMSPEQLSGGVITTATDIYSLGIVLFEMATGRLPFHDQHIIQSVMQRASEVMPDIRAMAPELDARWAATIARCLHRDPAARFESARRVIDSLRSTWRPPMIHWTRRQWTRAAVGAAGAAAAVALVPLGLRFYSRGAVLPEGTDVLLGPMTTEDRSLEGITELFRNQLSQSVRLNLIDGRKLTDMFKQMGVSVEQRAGEDVARWEERVAAAVQEAGWRLNAGLSIYGKVDRVGPVYSLHVVLETRGASPTSPGSQILRSFAAPDPAALMRSVREASLWVRETIGETASTIASFDRLPDNATTPSWIALAHYARGQDFFMKQDFNSAIDKFAEALSEDPKFTLAALRRADLLMTQNRQTEAFTQYRTGLGLLKERLVTRAEELYARGMFALDSGDLEVADRHFRTWSVEYPYDWRAPFYRMLPLTMNGHAVQTIELLQKLRTILPNYGDIVVQLGRVHLVLGQTTESRALLPEVRRTSRPERAELQEAYIRFREADCGGCLEILRRVQRSTSYRRGAADAMMQEGLLLIDAGYPEAAAANVDAFLRSGSWVDTKPEQIALRVIQAWAEMLSGQRRAAIDHARQAIEGETGPLTVALTGTVFARLGASDLAQRALAACDGFDDIPLYLMARHRISGELAKAAGHRDQALTELRAAAALEPTIAHRQYLIEALPPGDPERVALSLKAVHVPWQNLRPPLMHHIGAMRVAVADVNAAGLDDPFAKKFAEASRRLGAAL